MANEQYEIYQQGTAAALAEKQLALLNSKASPDASYPSLSAGSATGITGDVETASWMARQTNADGAALIESVKGNTLRWNQLVGADTSTVTIPSGHKYHSVIGGTSAIATSDGTAISVTGGTDQLFDLTQMFGAGNEPATVAEFEALFPEPYYEYDAGSLLSVNMEGIKTVGFNQWDEEWEVGDIFASDGQNNPNNDYWRSKGYMPVFPNTTYYITAKDFTPTSSATGDMRGRFYDADKNYIGTNDAAGQGLKVGRTFTTPANAHYLRFSPKATNVPTKEVCINISDPARNGTYEPYWRSERAIPASTYFPDGMREAGIVADELTNHEAIRRVGVGTVERIGTVYTGSNSKYAALIGTGVDSYSAVGAMPAGAGSVWSDKLGHTNVNMGSSQLAIGRTWNDIYAYAPLDADDSIFDQLVGATVWYQLATPTTTPIDPPLPMSYRTGAGGIERVMVAEGIMSAPPVFATRYPLDPADLAASIAPVDGPTATTNHQVGDLLMLGFTLCKATQVIVTGETIAIGTNVTRTTVAAELAALSE